MASFAGGSDTICMYACYVLCVGIDFVPPPPPKVDAGAMRAIPLRRRGKCLFAGCRLPPLRWRGWTAFLCTGTAIEFTPLHASLHRRIAAPSFAHFQTSANHNPSHPPRPTDRSSPGRIACDQHRARSRSKRSAGPLRAARWYL